jgi:hypothetical protein
MREIVVNFDSTGFGLKSRVVQYVAVLGQYFLTAGYRYSERVERHRDH